MEGKIEILVIASACLIMSIGLFLTMRPTKRPAPPILDDDDLGVWK